MDEANARSHIEAHAQAVARGDMEAVVADFTEEMRPQVPDLAPQLLPLPIKRPRSSASRPKARKPWPGSTTRARAAMSGRSARSGRRSTADR